MDLALVLTDEAPNFSYVLYSLHVYNGNYKAAAKAMYEFVKQLKGAVRGTNLAEQREFYLSHTDRACVTVITAMRLVQPEDQWLAIPAEALDGGDFDEPMHSDRLQGPRVGPKGMACLSIEDIEREYVLLRAQLELAKVDPETTATELAPAEAISMLASARY